MKKFLAAAALPVTAVGLWFGPRMAFDAMASPAHPAGYVDSDRVVAKLARNHHSPATQGGAFLPDVSIATADVRSAGQVEVK